MSKGGITINDVARRCGVSKVTVSYVLNGRQTGVRISEETRQRVRAAAQEMGYHPNALARGLARRRTDTLALVMQYPAVFSGWSGFIVEMMRGATDAASALGFDLMLHTKAQADLERDVAALADGRADGALLLRDQDDPMARDSVRARLPVRGGLQPLGPGGGLLGGLRQLRGRAPGRGAPVGPGAPADRAPGRLAPVGGGGGPAGGLRGGAAGAGRRGPTGVGVGGDLRRRGLCPAGGADVPGRMRRRPCSRGATTLPIRAMRVLREELGRRVPDDVSRWSGFDGTEVCEHTTPRLTSVRQPIHEMAARAMALLAAQVRQEPVDERHVVFVPTLVTRGVMRGHERSLRTRE